MTTTAKIFIKRPACLVLLTLLAFVTASAQQNPPDDQSDDVLRIDTELMQMGITVFDKQGKFVDGLKPEQFELRVDGKTMKISFFERVVAGTAVEEKQIAAAARVGQANLAEVRTGATLRGRTIVFFLDDSHLSLDSLERTRRMLSRFVEKEMNQNDQVAIASTTGQLGFLQQFTDNKAVLRTAVSRLAFKPYGARDVSPERTPMTEYMALTIERRDDPRVYGFYVDECMKTAPPMFPRVSCQVEVENRARLILLQAASVISATYDSFESLLQTAAHLPGRKLVFFVSDGFLLNTGPRSYDAQLKLSRITDAALRNGVVVYTIDARGLVSGQLDATGNVPFDPNGRLENAMMREIPASQDALNALASDTGGRFLKNQNYFDGWVTRMLDETSNYYLLAWRPETEEHKGVKYKQIEVSVKDRPDLTVRLPRGFLAGDASVDAKTADAKSSTTNTATPATAAKGTEAALISALGAPSARRGLPLQLSTSFVDVPGNGTVLTASMQTATDILDYGADGKQAAAIDIAGVILNDQGKPAGSFKNRLNINPLPSNAGPVEDPGVIYNHRVPLKPGIYQVRVAARDDRSGRVGSIAQWIEIPDLSLKRLTLSSLMLGGQFVGSGQKRTTDGAGKAAEQVQFSVDRRFPRGSHMSLLTIIYNAARSNTGSSTSNLEAQIEITRDGQTIINSPGRKVTVEANTDTTRIPYAADVALNTLPAGHYLLKVTITDRNTRTTASQQVTFDIE